MIQSHLYTNKPQTPLYSAPDDKNNPIHHLSTGNWVGVLERVGNWYHVICIAGDGWVSVDHVEERSPFNLHVQWEPGKPIAYVSAA